MLALVYQHAQSKPDAVGDVQQVEGLTAKLGQTQLYLVFLFPGHYHVTKMTPDANSKLRPPPFLKIIINVRP